MTRIRNADGLKRRMKIKTIEMTESEIRNFFAFCRNATTPQLREIIKRERAAGRGEDALIAEMVLEQREQEN